MTIADAFSRFALPELDIAMSTGGFFSLVVLLTLAAAVCESILGRMHRKRLRAIAEQWKMLYTPIDQFRLTARIARHFPVPGAANIIVLDLMYGIDCDRYRYIFTAEYTAGVISHKRRVLRAASFSEPRDRSGASSPATITLAPLKLSLIEQYRALHPS